MVILYVLLSFLFNLINSILSFVSTNFNLFEGRNKLAVDQHLQVLEKFGRYPQRNAQYGRESTPNEIAWLNDKDNLPMWAGGKLPFDQRIK